ncbi:MAG: pilus assembly protein PilP [Deltaproteobacteria bacterium]|nr:pilus assembly protein PilP [Deltaproteobacteria bacterium]
MSLRKYLPVALLGLAACGESVAPPPAASATPAQQAPKPAAPLPVEKLAESVPTIEYAYSPVGKRDPFRSAIDERTGPSEGPERPDCGPLCKWELDQLKLVAVISGISNPLAMVEDPSGRGYIVRRGTFVGKRNGKVTHIRSGELVVTEIYKDQMGKPHVNPVPIKLPAEQGPGGQEDQNLLTPEVAE